MGTRGQEGDARTYQQMPPATAAPRHSSKNLKHRNPGTFNRI
jgi:hypothetical protein